MRMESKEKRFVFLGAAVLMLAMLVACASLKKTEQAAKSDEQLDMAMNIVSRMSLEQKVGQLFMAGFEGEIVDEQLKELIADKCIGSFVLFSKNMKSPQQVADLTGEMQAVAARSGSGLPLIVAADQEQGRVMRLTRGLTLFPAAMALGKVGTAVQVREASAITGRELLAMGVNCDLAPVADVNNNPDNPVIGIRSFGSSPDFVGKMVAASVEGFEDAGVISCAKHFPGHGDVRVDSHLGLPVIYRNMRELEQVELVPFKQAVKANVPMIMTAHILFPDLDSDYPATASSAVLTEILRGQLGFKGVVVSDALEMRALSDHFDLVNLSVRIINAGCDLLLFSENLPSALTLSDIYDSVLAACQSGKISRQRLNEAVGRVVCLKNNYLLEIKSNSPNLDLVLRKKTSLRLSRSLTRRALAVNPDSNQFPAGDIRHPLVLLSDTPAFLKLAGSSLETAFLFPSRGGFQDSQAFEESLLTAAELWIFASSRNLSAYLQDLSVPQECKIRYFSLTDVQVREKLPWPVHSYLDCYGKNLDAEIVGEFLRGSQFKSGGSEF